MIDREKVLKGLECCSQMTGNACRQCPYDEECAKMIGSGSAHLCSDALALLKEQEAVEPILKREGRNKYYNYYVCPCCDEEVVYDQNYCSECGAKFMWEGR